MDGEGRVVISSRRNTYKVKNIIREPNVSMLVMGEEFHGSKYFQLDGIAEVIDLPDALDLLLDAYRRRLGMAFNEAESRKKIFDDDRVIIRVTIERVGPQN